MTQIQTFNNTDFGFRLQCVCVDGEAWFKADDAAVILGYTNTAEAISGFDDDDAKTLRELLPDLTVDCLADFYAHRDIFIYVYGIFDLVQKSQSRDAREFKRWLWSDVIKWVRPWHRPILKVVPTMRERRRKRRRKRKRKTMRRKNGTISQAVETPSIGSGSLTRQP